MFWSNRYPIMIAKYVFGGRDLIPDRGRPFLPNRLRFISNISNIWAHLVRAEVAGMWMRPVTSIVLCCVYKLKSAWSYTITSPCMARLLLKNTDNFISTLRFDIGLYGNSAQILPLNGWNILRFSAFYMRGVGSAVCFRIARALKCNRWNTLLSVFTSTSILH
jgi:hypothetical protein